MQMDEKPPDAPLAMKTTLKRVFIAVLFSIAFGYIEASVVVYLRTIFYPEGFTFPLTKFGNGPLWNRLLAIEVGREAATMVLIFSGAWLFGANRRQRLAYFLTIFAVWDIFYYAWLKVFLDWPGSIMDWDILFLIPAVWASPVLAPVLVSLMMLAFAVTIFYRTALGRGFKVTLPERVGFFLAGVVIVICFWIAGGHITEEGFEHHFYWPLFGSGMVFSIVLFVRCVLKSPSL